jgi:hypothetical protein
LEDQSAELGAIRGCHEPRIAVVTGGRCPKLHTTEATLLAKT